MDKLYGLNDMESIIFSRLHTERTVDGSVWSALQHNCIDQCIKGVFEEAKL